MYRNDLDFLHVEAPADAFQPAAAHPGLSDNSPGRVLWELVLVLAGALFFAAAVNAALVLFQVT